VKALTISQPFASLIADGEKWVENRTWETRYRGSLAIHAGKGTQYLSKSELQEYPHGCVIAVCDLVACVNLEVMRSLQHPCSVLPVSGRTGKTFAELFNHKHAEGPWCWVLENVRKIEPVPISGKQGLWTFESRILETA
jgi:hypothetical protein